MITLSFDLLAASLYRMWILDTLNFMTQVAQSVQNLVHVVQG